jgi:hypothetical protein
MTLCQAGQVPPIDVLPDDVLLEIFGFYVDEGQDTKNEVEPWQLLVLVHVCLRWRSFVFESPRCLKLRLLCTQRTHAYALDIWPTLPLFIHDLGHPTEGVDKIITALKQSHRVYNIHLWVVRSSKKVWAAMQEPFPELEVYGSQRIKNWPWAFPILSWVDLLHVCDISSYFAFHFRDCRNDFCLPLTSSLFALMIFLIPFHPR